VQLTSNNRMRNNRSVQHRKQIAAALLFLAAAAIPQLFWLGAHVSEHFGHDASGHFAEWSALAKSLVHGHQHGEDVPDHEHHLLPSPTFRPDPPQDLQAPAITSLEIPAPEHLLFSSAFRWQEGIGLSSSSPPRLHLLCTLLI
jgi:hypothetical protein